MYTRAEKPVGVTMGLYTGGLAINENSTKLISIPNFLPPGLQANRSSLLAFALFGHSESTKLIPYEWF